MTIIKLKQLSRVQMRGNIFSMKFYLLSLALELTVVTVSGGRHEEQWTSFKEKYGKKYGTPNVEEKRKNTFFSNLKKIEDHNEKFRMGKTQYTLGMNKFGDMYLKEMSGKLNKLDVLTWDINSTPIQTFNVNLSSLPREVDWRKRGIVTPVKDQKLCGADWAFAATGALEGQYALKTKRLVSLSEQNLIDCSSKQFNSGCSWGAHYAAWLYVAKNGGMNSESTYPYKGKAGPCRFNRSRSIAKLTDFKAIRYADENDLLKAVATIGPIAVSIGAEHFGFQFYKSGIYTNPTWDAGDPPIHAALLVGYGDIKGKPYWLVKNSWGTDWGTAGYVLMARNRDNMCGIATYATFPIF